ncbi:MAG: 50S ribosomal protein L15 [Oceanicaulis sp.]|jgi:large subunit ribosomal protein L15|uniref:50S ribosomal protein L15 n=1 Tax=unclassified Oceanicaulis TaxID=2632123 RepID=UPI000C4ACD2B|nr:MULTISPECIES: 50S ribosomal protein L15 [unclassified Oceanicaulis]MAB68895.1 50S ribosomal protein L15 [Oceanicaulis sp.]MBC39160.1 50S ribosomal protein L15 [Oceanicaulis sp.]MBG34831.1 50S ribosomal protein L15 [Oceanicaulis sp.]HBU62683.1 50S ribosomal protein L15 [Oceanicaulis sp.]|tara:strand:- start:51 stop:533 length:483 start_codon:yes stop_codon:yes gene_type:complete
MRLNELRDNDGATKSRMRVGRGIGSGKGKTGGRGVKGQKSRSGVAIKGFEGGQMPLYQRLPKRGFNKPNRLAFAEVTLAKLQAAVDAGKLDAKAPVDAEALIKAGVIRRAKDGVRVIGGGELKAKLELTVAGGSKPAIEAVEKAGGKVTVLAKSAKDQSE